MSECIVEFLDKWQTLISGGLALVAAFITVGVIHRQINLSEGHERRRREASEAAARAVLPLTLSAIVEYAQQSSDTLHALYNNREGEVIPERIRAIEFPSAPESAISSLQSIIESSTNPSIIKMVSKLIQKIQIQNSRIRSVIHEEQAVRPGHIRLVVARNIEEYVIDSAIIHTLAASLFAYARFESEAPEEVSWDTVSRSLWLLHWVNHIHTDLYEIVATRRARSALIE